MKKIFALAFASLLAFACVASPPGTPKLGPLCENFELQEASCDETYQVQSLVKCELAVTATLQKFETSYGDQSCQAYVIKDNVTTGTINNIEISPFPAELGSDMWRQVLSKFHFAYIAYGYHRRSNSPPPNLS